jgi:hypothetical protein
LERKWSRASIDRIKADLVDHLTFRGPVFDAFSRPKSDSASPDSELAARYRVLLNAFRDATTDERLRFFALWARAELNILPKDSMGSEVVERLSAEEKKRVSKIPLNDLRYAGIVRAWLPYVDRLFHDAKSVSSSLGESLRSLDYDQLAVEIFTTKRWRSPIEFICEWLAGRGGIQKEKPRKDPDISRTLRNAYSRIFGSGAPHPPK